MSPDKPGLTLTVQSGGGGGGVTWLPVLAAGLTVSSPGDVDAVVRAAYSYCCTDSLTLCYGTWSQNIHRYHQSHPIQHQVNLLSTNQSWRAGGRTNQSLCLAGNKICHHWPENSACSLVCGGVQSTQWNCDTNQAPVTTHPLPPQPTQHVRGRQEQQRPTLPRPVKHWRGNRTEQIWILLINWQNILACNILLWQCIHCCVDFNNHKKSISTQSSSSVMGIKSC